METRLSYSLADFLLFAPRTYHRLLARHNEALWPGQLVALAMGFAILGLIPRGAVREGRAIAGLLAAAWLHVAWAWHLERYATINWAASYLALGFGLEAALLLVLGVGLGRLRPHDDPVARLGLGLFLLALLLQPLLDPLFGRPWAEIRLFGLMPEPTLTASLGLILLLAEGWPLWLLLPLPLLGCLVSGATALALGEPLALLLPFAGGLALLLAALRPWWAHQ
jgi:hypothetical protein